MKNDSIILVVIDYAKKKTWVSAWETGRSWGQMEGRRESFIKSFEIYKK